MKSTDLPCLSHGDEVVISSNIFAHVSGFHTIESMTRFLIGVVATSVADRLARRRSLSSALIASDVPWVYPRTGNVLNGSNVYCNRAKKNHQLSDERGKEQIKLALMNAELFWQQLDEERHSIRTQ